MKLKYKGFLLILLVNGLACSEQKHSVQNNNPKLVVGIIVDQMRTEYLYRYQNNYSEKGFKRLINEGFEVKNTHFNYIPTSTAPGHTSVYTGTTPTDHGIVSNYWYDRATKKGMYCAEDTTVFLVDNQGISNKIDRYSRSPKNLMTTTITDELKLFTNNRAKVIGVSLKDRGAIFPAGHTADYAFWFHSETGDFITSSYYTHTLPDWLIRFNKTKKTDSLLNQTWNTILPIERYNNSNEDNSLYEYVFEGRQDATFPYNLKELRKDNGDYNLISKTPQGNTLLTDMAMTIIKEEQMGQHEDTDFLTISYSPTDYAGHTFGIRSVELEDMYIRLDNEIAQLLEYLDNTVGKNRYTVFLTADHAASDIPSFLKEKNIPSYFFEIDEITKGLNDHLVKTFGKATYIVHSDLTQMYLADEVRFNQKVLSEIKQYLNATPHIKNIYLPNLTSEIPQNQKVTSLFMNSYNKLNSGDVLLNFWSKRMPARAFGTTHGSGYNSDTQVPLLWYGAKIPKGGKAFKKATVDQITPTLSLLLNIPLPADSCQEPIEELFRN